MPGSLTKICHAETAPPSNVLAPGIAVPSPDLSRAWDESPKRDVVGELCFYAESRGCVCEVIVNC